jgi:hypothetical protein
MANTKTMNWKEEITLRIDKINEVTETIQNLLAELNEYSIEASVEVVEENNEPLWVISINEFKRIFKKEDFITYRIPSNQENVKVDSLGRPVASEKVKLDEAIIEAILNKFNWK